MDNLKKHIDSLNEKKKKELKYFLEDGKEYPLKVKDGKLILPEIRKHDYFWLVIENHGGEMQVVDLEYKIVNKIEVLYAKIKRVK